MFGVQVAQHECPAVKEEEGAGRLGKGRFGINPNQEGRARRRAADFLIGPGDRCRRGATRVRALVETGFLQTPGRDDVVEIIGKGCFYVPCEFGIDVHLSYLLSVVV